MSGRDQKMPLCTVGVDLSAGGSEALQQFFNHMPSDSGIAFIIVHQGVHDNHSLMAQLPGEDGRMAAAVAEHGIEAEPNRIYFIPSRKNITVSGGRLLLSDSSPAPGHPSPADLLFRSLAADCGARAAGIALPGTAVCCKRGMQAIEEAGGLAMGPEMADGMPVSLALTEGGHLAAASRQFAERLLEHAGKFLPTQTTDQLIHIVLGKIKQESGIDFTYYKRNSMIRRIERRMGINKQAGLSEYIAYLDEHPEELQSLRKDLLIGVTNFFRDAEAFETLYDKALPILFAQKPPESEIRVWVAGCSTGEEAYSVAILLRKYAEESGSSHSFKIFATDLDKESVEYASQGIYSDSMANHLTEEDIGRFFVKEDGIYRVSKEIRKMVVFAAHNMIKDPPFSGLDLITCRNMLIYLQAETQQKVLSMFRFALNPDGFLFLGPSETLGRSTDLFEPFDRRWNIFCRKDARQLPKTLSGERNGRTLRLPARRKADLAEPSPPAGHGFKRLEDLHATIAEEHLPPGMIIDANNDVIHLNGAINPFLMLAKGRPSLNLYKMLDCSLAVAVAAAIQKVRKDKREVVYRSLKVKTNHGERIIDLKIRPFSAKNDAFDKHVFVLFEEPVKLADEEDATMQSFAIESDVQHRIFELEQELRRLEETLQATVEELETSNEELQAANEELVVSNEELQSTNEELQSVNEELVTVNAEFQYKIQELTDVNNDMSNFLVSTRIGTIFLDKRLCIRRFTPAVTREFNLLEVDYGRPIGHISHNFKYYDLIKDAQQVLSTLEPLEKEIQNQEGSWYRMRILPYRTEDQFINGIVLTFVDINDLKTGNEELVKLSYAIEQSPSMVVMTNLDGDIEYVNPRFTEVTGCSLEDVSGIRLKRLILWDSIDEPFESVSRRIHAGEVWKGELQCVKKNGDLYWESVKFVPIKNKKDEIIHFLKLSEDISKRKHAEELLRKTEMLSAVGQLAAGIAHEIRNPLTSLKGFTKLISAGAGSKDSYIEIMLDELNRIEEIVSELLVLAKPQAIDLVAKSIEPILQDVILLLDTQAILNNVEIASEIEADLPQVMCVENQLKQVFINLLKNAIEAMPSGGQIEVQAFLDDERNIVIRFLDNGPGIPAHKLAKLGEPFYSTKEKGTGLGLTVSYKIIENHDGTIHFESEEGAGTTVTITLPPAE